MTTNSRLYVCAVYGFEHVLKLAKPAAFNRQSPCEGWKGKDVYEHALGNLAMIKAFASTGKGPKSTPKFGADPVGAWVKLREQTLAVLDDPAAMNMIATAPFGPDFGDLPIDVLLGFMAADLTPHTWDFARTAKVDERLDPALVKHTLAAWKALPNEALRSPGMIGAALKAPAGADAQTKMLAFMGRAV